MGVVLAIIKPVVLVVKSMRAGAGISTLFSRETFIGWPLCLAIFFLFFGFAAPRLLKPLQKLWMGLALVMGWVMSRLLLIVIFYFVMTPVGFLARLFGKDFLDIGNKEHKDSYWMPCKKKNDTKMDYENQF